MDVVVGADYTPVTPTRILDTRLRLAERWPWAGEMTAGVTRLQALPSG